jgi:integrase
VKGRNAIARRAVIELETQAAQKFVEAARAESTRAAYRSDWRHFVKWCESRGYRSAPPVAGELVALYLADLAAVERRALSTITRRLAAIAEAHAIAGLPSPRGTPALREVLRGIRRTYALAGKRTDGKAALELAELRTASAALPSWLIGLRDRAVLVVGWTGGFRRGELAALELDDLELSKKGYTVRVGRSKTDQTGEGQTKILPYGSDPLTCPVRSLQAWIDAAEIKKGRVFRRVDRHSNVGEALSGFAIAQIVKRRVAAVGLDPAKFAGHSLRAGFCTTAAKAGKHVRSIMNQTGHRSSAMVLRYVRSAELWDDNAAIGLGL